MLPIRRIHGKNSRKTSNCQNFCHFLFLQREKGSKDNWNGKCRNFLNDEWTGFGCIESLLRFLWISRLNRLNQSFDCTEMASLRCDSSEGSFERQRGLAWTITSPRTFSGIKCAFQSIPFCAALKAFIFFNDRCLSDNLSYLWHSVALRCIAGVSLRFTTCLCSFMPLAF